MQRKMLTVVSALLGLLLFAVVAQAAVELLYFTGVWTNDGSLLSWGTESEQDSQGFYLWRSTENLQVVNGTLNTAQATKVSPFIPGVNGGCDPLNGDDYSFTDTTANPNEDAYYYFIESLNCSSAGSVFYGDNGNLDGSGVLVVPGASSRLFLPVVLR